MAVVKKGTAHNFGIQITGDTGDGSAVTGYSQTTKREVKEVRDMTGQVISVALHRQTDDISIDFVGAPAIANHIPNLTAATAQLNSAYEGSSANEIYIDEVTTNLTNEGNRTTSVKATGYYNYD